ncbi:MAG: hypothetical protein JRL30_20405 [Deltaproteobacteria bacterium]|nr:hypothetical protein [Deltaproteobacteria bacterium]
MPAWLKDPNRPNIPFCVLYDHLMDTWGTTFVCRPIVEASIILDMLTFCVTLIPCKMTALS